LDRQRQPAAESGSPAVSAADQAKAAERERQLAEAKAAHESGILVSRGSAPSATSATNMPAPASAAVEGAERPKIALDPANDPNSQQRKTDFVGTLDPHGDANPHRLAMAPSPYLLSAGSVIPASLITGLRSDLPGLVTAQVTSHVYDSPTGHVLLIPQGARLV